MNMLQHFLDDFLQLVPLQLPKLLDANAMEEPQFFNDYVLLHFPLSEAYDLEEIMDMFEDDMELIMLYHHIPTNPSPFGHSACAYSNPAFGHMFKIYAQTESDGKVRELTVTIYDSLELMSGDLCLDLNLHAKQGRFKYQRHKIDVMFDFL